MKSISVQIRKLFIVAFCLACVTGCSSDIFKSKEVPVITDFQASRYEVDPGDTVQVSVSVKDSKDASLQYKWSATGGQFIPPVNQPQILWKAPDEGGDYTLTVRVSNADGDSDPHSEIIHVRIKEAPEILSVTFSAREVDPGDTVEISVLLRDMTDPTLDFIWETDGGQFLAPFNLPTVLWKAPAVGGEYTISLTVANDKKTSDPFAETMTVRSYAAPFVQIGEPAQNAVFIQYSTVQVAVTANHQNGIAWVSIYVNDNLQSEMNGKADEHYLFQCELNGPPGITDIRAEAVARTTGVIGSDRIQVRVEGILLGK
ncbi:hypothetical protein JW948_14500 [bacterium]|nr:hypothetical protein [bacterium]